MKTDIFTENKKIQHYLRRSAVGVLPKRWHETRARHGKTTLCDNENVGYMRSADPSNMYGRCITFHVGYIPEHRRSSESNDRLGIYI